MCCWVFYVGEEVIECGGEGYGIFFLFRGVCGGGVVCIVFVLVRC